MSALAFTVLLVTSIFAMAPTYSSSSSLPDPGPRGREVLLKMKGMSPTSLMELVDQPRLFYGLVVGTDTGLEQASSYVTLGQPRHFGFDLFAAPAVGDPSGLISVAGIDGVHTVWVKPQPDVPNISGLAADPDNIVPETDSFVVRELLGVNQVGDQFGLDGAGITVAVVDTGTDYSNPDLIGALEYVDLPNGGREPLVLDADETQVLLLQPFTQIEGKIPTAAVRVTTVTASPFRQSSVANANYNVTAIPTMSGIYRFGMTQQAFYRAGTLSGVPSSFSRVGVLLYDPHTHGDYTAARADLNNNKDFTDDIEISYHGDRVSRLDTDNDGFPDRQAGVLGGFFHDIFFQFGRVARYLPGWDRNGLYISIFYDSIGHGTAVAGHIASRGITSYDLPAFGAQKLPGIAPGAKILAVKALTVGNVEGGMLFAAGFDVDPAGKVYYTGSRRADVITNSWGLSAAHYDQFGFGYDLASMFENGLALPGFLDPSYPGIVIVHAAGNGNFGYGTVTSPGTASFVISVGASTSLHTTTNLFGFSPEGKTDEVVPFSARGPSPLGELKPDVVNVGAFAWDIGRIFEGSPKGTTIFGGTSEATPLTAGVVALVLQSTGKAVSNPFQVRTILQSTARDLGYNPFAQSNGRVDAYRAVLAAKRLNGETVEGPPTYIVSTHTSVNKLTQILREAWRLQWGFQIPEQFLRLGMVLPPLVNRLPPVSPAFSSYPSGSLYLGRVRPGETTGFEIMVKDVNGLEATLTYRGIDYAMVGQTVITESVSVPTINTDIGGPSGDLEGQMLLVFSPEMFVGSQLTHFNLLTDFSKFDLQFNYGNEYRERLWVFEWTDDGDEKIEAPELRQFTYGFPHGTSVQVTVADLVGKLANPESRIVVRVDANRRASTVPAKSIPFTLQITMYARVSEDMIKLSGPSSLPTRGEAVVSGTLTVPQDAAPGVHERMLEVSIETAMGLSKRLVPLSFSVLGTVSSELTITPPNSAGAVLYDLGAVKGAFDWSWRYESGDWRVYTVEVTEPNAFALEVSFTWTYDNTTVDIFVLGPDGQFAGITPGSGTPYSRNLSAGIFRWHSIVDAFNRPLRKSLNLASTRYALAEFAHGGHPQVFTIYIHEVLHAGKALSETVVGRVKVLATQQRLPRELLVSRPNLPKSISTSITLPYSVAPSPSSPEPSDRLSLIIVPDGSRGVKFTPPFPARLVTTFPRDTIISTDMVGLEAEATSIGDYLIIVVLLATIPDLRVYNRFGNFFAEFFLFSVVPQIGFSSPVYLFQDWTVLSVRGQKPGSGGAVAL